MPNRLSEKTRLDAVSRLTADVRTPDAKALDRVKSLINAAISEMPAPQKSGAIARSVGLSVDAETRKAIRDIGLSEADAADKPLGFNRRDLRDDILEARLAGPLTALSATERLGPFDADGGNVFFEFYRAARRLEVREKGAALPALVMTAARVPRLRRPGPLKLPLPEGAIWIRGNLVDAALPAGAYVGITISGGEIALPHSTSIDPDGVVVAAPFEAKLTLKLSAATVAAGPGGCRSGASVELPELTLTFGATGMTLEGGPGEARAWRQTFTFEKPTGSIDFLAPLWTLLIGYTVEPDRFNGGAIKSDLADFSGKAQAGEAALSLPVVVANPSVLGAAAVSPGWALRLRGLKARWYEPDERFHRFDCWMGIGAAGTLIYAPRVRALDAPVESVYRLWELAEAPGNRLPWKHSYDTVFLYYHACHVANGETMLTTGSADVRLDRPFETNGRPVQTPTTIGVMHQHKGGGPVQVTLGALTGDADKTQFALRNAVIWTTRAAALIATGRLTDRQLVNSGMANVVFGVFAWSPTLPDPYVGNFQFCRPDVRTPSALTAARITWTDPEAVTTEFVGELGAPLVCGKRSSPIEPVPAPTSDLNPYIGPTQTEQDTLYLGEEALGVWNSAQKREQGSRGERVEKARSQNERSERDLGSFLERTLGRTPPILLLDVSTNQDILGVALWGGVIRDRQPGAAASGASATSVPPNVARFAVDDMAVRSQLEALRLVTLPQIQWEPVRTLDADQDILTLGWFPTPLASATDGGATVLGARHQKMVPAIPDTVLEGTLRAFEEGTDVVFRTTLPFGIVTVVEVTPQATATRKADHYEVTRPAFPGEDAVGGHQITAKAEGDRDPAGGISPTFGGMTRQMINGVDLATGVPLGLSVLGSTLDPTSNTEAIFNNDMIAHPRVPITRFDLSGYGGSNFSKWENPFALFAETSKTQFQVMTGRTALEIIKVASVLHPWGIRVTREVIVERQAGGGVIRRDTGWQAASPGIFDYRYTDATSAPATPPEPAVADYVFDAGIFEGFFNVRSIRPAPGVDFSHGPDSFVPYYFDADLALDGLSGRTPANGILGWLQTKRPGLPASKKALEALIEAQGPIGGPIDTWIDFGASKLPFRAQRIEVGLADDAGDPLFVATVRGVPKFPKTGSWSVVRRPVAVVPPDGGEAVPVADSKGAPIIRRYQVEFEKDDTDSYPKPRQKPGTTKGDWRIADATDLLTPASPQNDYGILQGAPTHAFLFPRPYAAGSGPARLRSSLKPELADVIARSTSKGAFPPPQNAIQLAATYHFNVGAGGTLALSSPVTIDGSLIPLQPLRLSGSSGHGSELIYDNATLHFEINASNWEADFTGLKIWSDIAGMSKASGAGFRVVGSTTQRPQMTQIETLVHPAIDKILTYLPIFGAREVLGPIDLGASNAKHEIKVEVGIEKEVPENGWSIGGATLKLKLGTTQKTGFDVDTGGIKASASIKAGFKGEFPILSVGAASVYVITQLDVKFSIASISGTVTSEKFDLLAFAGIGVKGSVGPFEAYAFLGIGFVMTYDIPSNTAKYGGLVRFEAGVSVAIVKVKLTAELKGLVYKDDHDSDPTTPEITQCDYSGSVKLQVDIFLIISISATYNVTGTKELE